MLAGGIGAFWKGTAPKLVESASKGAVLLYAKEAPNRFDSSLSVTFAPFRLAFIVHTPSQVINDACVGVGIGPTAAGFLAGGGGGVCQTVVMGPCTFLVTAVVTGSLFQVCS